MFFVEIVASHVGDSMSLQADALDFFSDSANYAISLFVVGMAITARAKATLFKGATMALFGAWVIGSAVYRAMTGSAPDPSMMGAIALPRLGRERGRCLPAVPVPGRRQQQAIDLAVQSQRRDRQRGRDASGGRRICERHSLARPIGRRHHRCPEYQRSTARRPIGARGISAPHTPNVNSIRLLVPILSYASPA